MSKQEVELIVLCVFIFLSIFAGGFLSILSQMRDEWIRQNDLKEKEIRYAHPESNINFGSVPPK